MAKTRRKKINKRPTKIFKNSKVIVVENGMGVKVAGYRSEGKQIVAKGETVKAIHIGRVYTGVNYGKTYPYAGKKRGGATPGADVQDIEGEYVQDIEGELLNANWYPTKRKTVGVIDG